MKLVKVFCLVMLFFCTLSSIAKKDERLIVMSVDGLGWHELKTLKQNDSLAGGVLTDDDYKIRPLAVVATGNTGPSHVTAFTGSTPQEGGWVGNTYLSTKNAKSSVQTAFTAVTPDSEIEHIVTKLKNKGHKIACLNVPTINPNLNCDFQLSFSRRIEPSCSYDLSSVKESIFCGSDKVTLNTSQTTIKINDAEVSIQEGVVAPVCWSEGKNYFSRLVYKENREHVSSLYIGPKHSLNANDTFKNRAKPFTCWPGVIDGNAIRLGKISQQGFYNISLYQHDYAMQLLEHVLSLQEYDTIFAYTSFLDSVQHELLGEIVTDNNGNKQNLVENAFSVISYDLEKVTKTLRDKDSMLVFSDHGFQKSDYVVFVAGFVKSLGIGVSDKSQPVRVLTSGGLGHLYASALPVNELTRLKTSLLNLKIDNKSVFNFVIDKVEKGQSSFNHPNSGDLVFMVNPGFSLDPRMPPTKRFIYPSMSKPDKQLETLLDNAEYSFLQRGTSNRGSPGVHGFNNEVADIDGIIFGTNKVKHVLQSDKEDKTISDVAAIIEKAATSIN